MTPLITSKNNAPWPLGEPLQEESLAFFCHDPRVAPQGFPVDNSGHLSILAPDFCWHPSIKSKCPILQSSKGQDSGLVLPLITPQPWAVLSLEMTRSDRPITEVPLSSKNTNHTANVKTRPLVLSKKPPTQHKLFALALGCLAELDGRPYC